jgi:hypothetical protein
METLVKITELDFYCTHKEMRDLLASAIEIGVQEGAKLLGKPPKAISQREAQKLFGHARVKTWITDALIAPKTLGNGKNSKKMFDYSELLKLSVSEKIKIRKPYIRKSEQS